MTSLDHTALAEHLRFVEAIFGPFESDAGVPPEDLAVAEERLGLALPKALRELYLRTGQVSALHAAHNLLVPLDRIEFGDDHLIFYEENQGVVAWGISRSRLSEIDPPVDQGAPPRQDEDPWEFFPEFTSVSEFACAQAAWQAVRGGLPFVGVKEEHAPASVITESLGAPAFENAGMRAWLLQGGVVIHHGDASVGLATHEAESFLAASNRLGIAVEEWDYATLQAEAD